MAAVQKHAIHVKHFLNHITYLTTHAHDAFVKYSQ